MPDSSVTPRRLTRTQVAIQQLKETGCTMEWRDAGGQAMAKGVNGAAYSAFEDGELYIAGVKREFDMTIGKLRTRYDGVLGAMRKAESMEMALIKDAVAELQAEEPESPGMDM